MTENNTKPKISSYCYVRNAVEMDYPFLQSIQSFSDCCDEVVVVDASDIKDSDGTKTKLLELAAKNKKIKIFDLDVDWSYKYFGVYDGQTKTFARSKCLGDVLIQFDVDEVLTEEDSKKIKNLCNNLPESVVLLALPVIEPWGSKGKIRVDVNFWKWRISRNKENIVHGIPAHLRMTDEQGRLFAAPGTDGCDYIDKTTGQVIPVTVPIQQFELLNNIRINAISNVEACKIYEDAMNKISLQMPTVWHYSWYSIYDKIIRYKLFWNQSWKTLYNENDLKGKDWNPFFDVGWDSVTEEMLKQKAHELEEKCGGHVFHTKYQGQHTNSINLTKKHPEIMNSWLQRKQKESL